MFRKTKPQRLLLLLPLYALLLGGCGPTVKPPRGRTVRIALLQGAGSVTVSAKGSLSVKEVNSRRRIVTAGKGNRLSIRSTSNGLNVAGDTYAARGLDLRSSSGEISVNGRPYPGSLRILRKPGGLSVINLVDLASYLKGVVPSEMISSWPPEALKAQAVVSRSFVLHHAMRNKDKDFDLSSRSQIYNPAKRDRRTDKAVDATRDIVIIYKGDLLLPFFCTSCGGFTEYAANVWGSEEEFPPPVECPFCSDSPEVRWQHRTSIAEFRRKLASAGIAGARSIGIHRRSAAGGRITALKIQCENRDEIVKINRFRMIMGPNLIRSGFFEIESRDGYLTFNGRGWGHGVGMCQKGAKNLAERGKSFASILRHYFPGVRTKKMRW